MDVERELRAATRRVQKEVDRKCLEATARLYGMTPEDYRAKLAADSLKGMVSGMELVGRYYRDMYDALVEAGEAFARGWQVSR